MSRMRGFQVAVVMSLFGLGCGGAQSPVERARYEPPPSLPPYEPPAQKDDPLDALDELEAAARAEDGAQSAAPRPAEESEPGAPGESGPEGQGAEALESESPPSGGTP